MKSTKHTVLQSGRARGRAHRPMFEATIRFGGWRLAIVTSIMLCLVQPVRGQTFQRIIGSVDGERLHGADGTTDGGYVVVGSSGASGGQAFVVKVDASGDMDWNLLFGHPNQIDRGHRILQTSDGGYVVAGETGGSSDLDLMLTKLSASGAVQWALVYPGTAFTGETSLDLVGDDGFIIAGRLVGAGGVEQAPVLVRVSSNGGLVWAHYFIDTRYDTDTYASFEDVHVTATGFAATGWTAETEGGMAEGFLMLIDADGFSTWTRTYSDGDIALHHGALELATNGDYLMTFAAKGDGTSGTYFLRVDSIGDVIWAELIELFDTSFSFEEVAGGDIVIAGNAPGFDAGLLKTDGGGNYIWGWNYTYGHPSNSFGAAVVPANDGGYMVGAWTQLASVDYYLIKTDPLGSSGCEESPYSPDITVRNPTAQDVAFEHTPAGDSLGIQTLQTSAIGPDEVICFDGLPCVDPPANMVAWWPLDEAAGPVAEDIALDNDGTWTNGPGPQSGMVDGALCFDGINDYVAVPHDASLSFGQGDFSIDAWVRTTNASGVQSIVDKRTASPLLGYTLFLFNGNVAAQLADNNGAGFTNYVSTLPAADGLWHHVAVTVDRVDPTGLTLHMDCQTQSFNPASRTGSLDNTAPLWIAARSPVPSVIYFRGCIDEVEIFNRALGADEICAIYEAGSAGKCKEPGGCVRDPQWQCDGDVDGDGQVNPVDSGLVQAAFGSTDEQDLCNYDVDCDGQINPVDSGIVQSLFGTCDPPRDECQ